uniref:Putative tequila n=1 Tax=Corethrella appendiculata TaxID=1370023 RepID=U5EDI3_9DIPT
MHSNTLFQLIIVVVSLALSLAQSAGENDEIANNIDNACRDSGKLVGLIPHPSSCTKYIACIFSVPRVFDCVNGLIFNPTTSTCVRRNQYNCTIGTISTTLAPILTTTTTQTITTSAPVTDDDVYECQPNVVRIVLYKDDCSKFAVCENGTRTTYHCDSGQLFSSEKLECLPEAQVNCNQPNATEICNEVQYGSVPHPTDCRKFLTCFAGEATIEQCLDKYIFDKEKLYCVPGNSDSCN